MKGLEKASLGAGEAIPELKNKEFCPKCGFPVAIGETCQQCVEDKALEEKKAIAAKAWDIKRLGGLKAYERFTFDNYDNKAAIDKCEGYPDINLYLWGLAGTGKTHLATALVRFWDDGRVVKPQAILRRLRGLKSGKDEQAVLDTLAGFPHLVIDDLGVEKSTAFSLSSLYEIIESRDMAYRTGLIVTSNLSLTALAEKLGDDRIASRLAGMCRVIQITGTDRRLPKQQG